MKIASNRVFWMIISGGALVVLLTGALFFLLYREFSFRRLELINTMENHPFKKSYTNDGITVVDCTQCGFIHRHPVPTPIRRRLGRC